ncbi:HlyD family type I secretion periplasmic adaptor subunit [Burkholderia lata]|uniref:Membrane fusion protein (MFP) family protein n=1 Tax=Burkholderia lata (strain ATCC 17760 / DSM 23089 / LMG 22485 / NCIMB 9086 / R18194 / 383) TaxID=482957 RepID=A0A6P2NU96_BURL3|nr:HlyD family type I secretion periplasmic adaptor subunit [Burkholderia lata]VWB98363.1 type I secretion membrane fusion protein, HlyD family protein [Burkholderia lata]
MSDTTNRAAPRRHPLYMLLVRYRSAFRAAWGQRHELAGPTRMTDEAAFLPAALSLQVTPPHPAPRRAMWVIVTLFALALLWACLGQVDIVAEASGRIVVIDGTKLVQPLETNVVKAIKVKDGDRVKAGQPLIELDPLSPQADHRRIGQERNSSLSELWRTQALIQAVSEGLAQPVLPGQDELKVQDLATVQAQLQSEWQDLRAQRARLDADMHARQAELVIMHEQIAKIRATLPIVKQRETDFNSLAKQGYVSRHDDQDRTQARIEMEHDMATLRARQDEVKATIEQANQAVVTWRADTLKTLNERHAKADLQQRQLQAEGDKASQRVRQTTLTAPVDGTVQQLSVHTTGGVVTPAQVLLVVVPEKGRVMAEVTLENKDVGFVNVGQSAEIKLETFPYTRYGTVPGKVTTITADAVMQGPKAQSSSGGPEDKSENPVGGAVFPAALTLAQNFIDVGDKRIRLTPGMNLTAEIKTGRRRVIDYLLSSVQTYSRESLRER